jgi:polyisoprenoid-binding protein YceI
MNKILSTIICVLLLSISSLHAQTFVAKDGKAEFISDAQLLEFTGTSTQLAGLINLDKNLVDFYLDLNTLDTGIELRNKHMRNRYLETDDHPFAEFTGEIVSSFDPQISKKQQVKVQGSFKVHGVAHEMTLSGTINPTKEGLQLNASWSILLETFDIERPSIVFYKLANKQKINISILLKPKQ